MHLKQSTAAQELANMVPSCAVNNTANVPALEVERCGNQCSRLSGCRSNADRPYHVISQFGGMMTSAFWRRTLNALTGTKCIASMISTPRLDERTSAGWANFRKQRRLGPRIMHALHMSCDMERVRQQFQVLKCIVSTMAIFVMDIFSNRKGALEMRTHYKTVLKDIAAFARVWVCRHPNKYITVFCAPSVVPFGIMDSTKAVPFDEPNVVAALYAKDSGFAWTKSLSTSAFTEYAHCISFLVSLVALYGQYFNPEKVQSQRGYQCI